MIKNISNKILLLVGSDIISGPAYEEYPEMFQCKWIFKVDSNDHALKRYRGWFKWEKFSQFATLELFQHFFTSRGHHSRTDSSTLNRKPETLTQAKDAPCVMQNLINLFTR